MKSLATIITLLTASAAAAPALSARTFLTVTISLSNDITGHSAAMLVATDGTPSSVGTLFTGSAIDINGETIATSAQFTQFVQGTFCVSQDFAGTMVANVNTDKTFVILDENPNAAVPTDISDLAILCEV